MPYVNRRGGGAGGISEAPQDASPYSRQDAGWVSAGGAAGLVFLSSVTASASATVDLETTFDSTFDAYLIVASDIVHADDSTALLCRLKVGGTFDTGANYQFHTHRMVANITTYVSNTGTVNTSFTVAPTRGTGAGEGAQFHMILTGVSGTTLTKRAHWHGTGAGASFAETIVGGGLNTSTAALTGVRFFATTGNITSGTFRLYGIVNS